MGGLGGGSSTTGTARAVLRRSDSNLLPWPSDWLNFHTQGCNGSAVLRSLSTEACSAEWPALLWGKHTTQGSFPKPELRFWSHGALQLAVSKKTGTCILDQILILITFQWNIYIPTGGLFQWISTELAPLSEPSMKPQPPVRTLEWVRPCGKRWE